MNYDYHDHDSNNHSNENLLGAADKRRKTWREVDRWAVSIGSKIIKVLKENEKKDDDDDDEFSVTI